MIRPRSNISASLHKKRQASLLRRCIYYSIFVLFFISLVILGLTTKEIQIRDIVVSGNSAVPTENILNETKLEMNTRYLWIIPTDNIFLLRSKEIKNNILDNIKQIGSVNIGFNGINNIKISVTEREAKNLWCKGTPTNSNACYFMDSNGLVFEDAPQFSEDTFPKYFGLIIGGSPVGQYYLTNNFKSISGLFSALKRMSFMPVSFNALNNHEYEIYLSGGGKILINDGRPFEYSLINLQALIDNDYIKTDTASIKKIKYIDLRFGNKVPFELNK
jgi:cell division septal protein FtsQ